MCVRGRESCARRSGIRDRGCASSSGFTASLLEGWGPRLPACLLLFRYSPYNLVSLLGLHKIISMSWREYSLSVSVFGFRGCLPVLFAPFANVAASSFPGNLIWSQLQQGPAGGQCLPRSPLEKKLLRFGSWSGALFQKGLSMHDKVTSGRLRGSSSLISTSGKAPVSLKSSPNIHTDS